MVKILIDEKMVQKDDKGILSLTQKGSECAKEIYEKHCFSYELLVSAGIDDKLAQKEVCKMEHDLSEESFQKIKRIVQKYECTTEPLAMLDIKLLLLYLL